MTFDELFTYFLGNLWVLWLVEAFGRLVPVRTNSLASQLYLILILLNDLTQAEVCDFDLSIVEDNVLGLQVVVDNFLLLIGQVLEPGQNLRDNQFRLFLLDLLVLFQVVV